MPEISTTHKGGTMRLGLRRTNFVRECKSKKLYGNVDHVDERHRHRYEVCIHALRVILCFTGGFMDGHFCVIFVR
eukprot:m.418887 g.418887  ORF g.418887 m.418887 type:complete len:75 (+) comp56626_c0_seq11:1872-2096(+)